MQVEETTYYLEMLSPDELRPAAALDGVEVRQAQVPCPELNRFFYVAVGSGWYWIDRLGWTNDQWQQYVSRPDLETWLLYLSGTPAGYFELDGAAGAPVEIAYFGLLPRFVGQGLGGCLLLAAVQRAWDKGASRVWVHTSSLDHPRALANYLARGFRLYRTETAIKDLPGTGPARAGV